MIVLDSTDLERSLLDLPRGKVVDVVVARDGREQTLQLTIGIGKSNGTPVVSISKQSDANDPEPDQKTVEIPPVTGNVFSETEKSVMNRAWDLVGLRLENLSDAERLEIARTTFPGVRKPVRYNGGLRVVSVRVAPSLGFVSEGDILLGLDGFETLGPTNISYILRDARISNTSPMKCQIIRKGSNPIEGTITLTNP